MLIAEELARLACALADFVGDEQDVVFLAEIINGYNRVKQLSWWLANRVSPRE